MHIIISNQSLILLASLGKFNFNSLNSPGISPAGKNVNADKCIFTLKLWLLLYSLPKPIIKNFHQIYQDKWEWAGGVNQVLVIPSNWFLEILILPYSKFVIMFGDSIKILLDWQIPHLFFFCKDVKSEMWSSDWIHILHIYDVLSSIPGTHPHTLKVVLCFFMGLGKVEC